MTPSSDPWEVRILDLRVKIAGLRWPWQRWWYGRKLAVLRREVAELHEEQARYRAQRESS
jgi:hypothetical protein